MSAERLNPSQRKEWVLVEECPAYADIWPLAESLEARAKACFPESWVAEIRVFQGTTRDPRAFRVKCISTYLHRPPSFQIQILSPATSVPHLGCWVIRAFKIPPRS